jgi:hypothetical protein
MVVKMQTEGLTNDDSLLQLPFNGICLNWVLGHIANYRDQFLTMLGASPVMEDRGLRYQTDSDPLKEADEQTLPPEDLLAWIDHTQERPGSTLSRIDETALLQEVTRGEQKATVSNRLFFGYFHESYHVGQTELFRQLAGKNDKVM